MTEHRPTSSHPQTRGGNPMLEECWLSVADSGQALTLTALTL